MYIISQLRVFCATLWQTHPKSCQRNMYPPHASEQLTENQLTALRSRGTRFRSHDWEDKQAPVGHRSSHLLNIRHPSWRVLFLWRCIAIRGTLKSINSNARPKTRRIPLSNILLDHPPSLRRFHLIAALILLRSMNFPRIGEIHNPAFFRQILSGDPLGQLAKLGRQLGRTRHWPLPVFISKNCMMVLYWGKPRIRPLHHPPLR